MLLKKYTRKFEWRYSPWVDDVPARNCVLLGENPSVRLGIQAAGQGGPRGSQNSTSYCCFPKALSSMISTEVTVSLLIENWK